MLKESSLFSQLLRQIPRYHFESFVSRFKAERSCKGFSCWTQFVAMLFCHMAKAESLREICNGLSCCLGKLVHLGIKDAPNKSSLSYANRHRPAELYESLFYSTLERFRDLKRIGGRKRKFRFKNKILSLESTTISLCLNLFRWADFCRSKGGIKAHVLLDHDDYMPRYVLITRAKKSDVHVAHRLRLNKGSIVVLDRAYVDYSLFGRWTRQGVYFVTRLKNNAHYDIERMNRIPKKGPIMSDQTIRLSSPGAKADCPYPLRRITLWDATKNETTTFLTNHHGLSANTVAEIYKDRWEIELFFKAIKQHLKIKTFIGTSRNALLIQIWTAMIALLLFRWLHHLSKAKWSLSNLVAMLRMNLFTYRDLMAWIHKPFQTPPTIPKSSQLSLFD
jgi:hypothetical protein